MGGVPPASAKPRQRAADSANEPVIWTKVQWSYPDQRYKLPPQASDAWLELPSAKAARRCEELATDRNRAILPVSTITIWRDSGRRNLSMFTEHLVLEAALFILVVVLLLVVILGMKNTAD